LDEGGRWCVVNVRYLLVSCRLEMAADEVGGSAIVPFAADTAGNIAEEGEVGGSSPVPIVEDTEQEIQPEDEEQALALNADGLRFWLNEASPPSPPHLTPNSCEVALNMWTKHCP
jgi:hypothetical protein